jgi:RHS repeat-associated protein
MQERGRRTAWGWFGGGLAGLVLVGVVPAAAAEEAVRASLRPIVECVVENGPGSFTAHFGYENGGPAAVRLAAGPANRLSPGPAERGQPTSFAPGRTPRFPSSAFKLDFDGRDLTWTLVGPDGRTHTATASAGSRRCRAVVDAYAPRLFLEEPANGAYLATANSRIRLSYEDDGGLDLSSLRVVVDGVDRTGSFSVGPREAVAEGLLEPALSDGRHRLEASIRDDAGRTGSLSATFTVDTVPPQLSVLRPLDGGFESAPAVDVRGGVTDASPVVVKVGAVDATVSGAAFRAVGVPLGPGPELRLPVVARDAAGNTATWLLHLHIERRPPVVRITAPADGAHVKGPSVRVVGTIAGPGRAAGETHVVPVAVEVNGQPAVVEGGAFHADVPAPGGRLALRALARSASGLLATDAVMVDVDSGAPGLTVDSPRPDTVTSARSLQVSGRTDDPTATVRINGVAARMDAGAFSGTLALPHEGRQTILVTAQDAAGNRSEVTVPVRVDRTAPSLRVLSLPEGAPVDGRAVSVVGTTDDEGAVSVTVNGRKAERLERGWRADLTELPAGRHVLEAVARDEAGNETRVRRTVTVSAPSGPMVVALMGGPLRQPVSSSARTLAAAAQALALTAAAGEGAVVGQVLSDLTGLPVAGATVRLEPGGLSTTTDEAGRFRFTCPVGPVILSAEKAEMTTAYRTVSIEEALGTVVVDARLVPLGAAVPVDGSGGALSTSFARRLRPADATVTPPPPAALTLTLPPGSVAGANNYRLTPLSPQSLPDLLPLGYSPIVAWNLEGTTPPSLIEHHATGLPNLPLHLVTYDIGLDAWTLVASALEPVDGTLDFTLAGLGTWALVFTDPVDPPLPLPAPGGTLTAAPFAAIPEAASGRSFADPPSLPASGGTSHGRVEVDFPQPLPSGTLVQAAITESYVLVSGQTSTGEERFEDILLFRADLDGLVVPEEGAAGLAAQLPIVASRQLSPAELAEGRVHLRVLAGREGVRNTGGTTPVTLTSGGASLTIPAGALPEDTALSFNRVTSISPYVPQPAGFTAMAEVVIDLSGATLAQPAELRVPALGVPAGGSLFVARVELAGGETRMQVMAWAERDGDAVVTRPWPPLPGLRQGGRYVVYHAVPAVGFLAGSTKAAGQPTPAIVTTSRLPFVGISGADGAYCVLTLAGSVRASARVLGTSLVGTADAEVAAGSVRPLDIEVTQTITIGVVTPASGATGVPVTRQVEIAASAPLDPVTAVASSVSLRRTSDGAPQSVRTVLSSDARHLAVIPETPLAYLTSYTFESSSALHDVYGFPVAVPVVEFTTQAEGAYVLDLDALVFSYPVDGMVTMRAPAGALPAGTQILVLNASIGSAIGYTVGSLPVEAEIRASIEDRLWVTVTDPQGHVTTFERTEYVAPDGRTAVGVAGGKVRGPDGSEMRLPAGATDQAVTIKLASFPEGTLAGGRLPDLPGAHFGYGLLIESADKPRFSREVDLAFPRPKDAPEGAFFYVCRKIDLPGDRVAFETVDEAFAEGDKVVTASFPFAGYQTSYGVLGGGAGQGALEASTFNHVALMWTYDELMPGHATTGVITGQVLRAATDPDTGALIYEPEGDAVISGVNGAGYSQIEDPGSDSVSTAWSDSTSGTFALFDSRYTGGLVQVSARTKYGETKTATAYESDPTDSENKALRFFPHIARVTFTFDPREAAPGPPVVDVSLVKVDDAGKRSLADSLVVEGVHLLVGIRCKNADIESVTINGQGWAFTPDTAPASDPLAFDVITSGEFVASPPGMHRIEVRARDKAQNLRTVTRNFRVVSQGGGNGEPLLQTEPEVLDGRTFPRPDAKGVEITALPQVEFSEPVRNAPGNVRLIQIPETGPETEVAIRLLGLPPGAVTPVDVTPSSQAEVPVVSLVVRPQPGLLYGTKYRLELLRGIVDLDPTEDGGPRPLAYTPPLTPPDTSRSWAYQSTFTTVTLAEATSRDSFPSPGIVVQDGFAYLVENEFTRGTLKVYDVSQPSMPTPVPSAERTIENRPVDLAIKPERLVVGTSVPARSVPSNLHVFDISRPDDPQWVGAASVSNGVLDGVLHRVVVHGRYAYGLVHRKGVQVVDIPKAEANFAATGGPSEAAYWLMRMALNTDGQGFGMDAIVATIPLPVDTQVQWYPLDLDVGDYVLDERTQALVIIGAEDRQAQTCPLLVGSPATASIVSRTSLRTTEGQDLCPILVALGRVAGRDVAVLGVALGSVSYAADGFGLAVVDVTDPRSPLLLGFTRLSLPDLSDLVLHGETALVASAASGTELVELGDPGRPYSAGHIDNLSGRLAVDPNGAYFSTGGTYSSSPEGGLHVATPGAACNLLDLRDDELLLEVVRDPVDGTLCGGADVMVLNVCKASHVTLRIDDSVAALSVDGQPASPIADLPLSPGTHVVTVPFGTIGTGLDTMKRYTLQARDPEDAETLVERQGTIRNKLLNRPVLPVGRTFVKGVDLFDGHVVRQATDLKVAGRHLGLEVTRTYSSAARGEDGTIGAGWGWNYSAAVSPTSCGLYNVSTADGGGQVFRSTDGGNSFAPQKGYHGKLNRLPDSGFEYIDKAGVKHYFREPLDPTQPEGARRLDRIVEPHGDRVEVAYDLLGRVASVREVLKGERPVRWLDVRYVQAKGHDRVTSVESSLGQRVEYGYDAEGNLTSVKRSGGNVDGGPDAAPATESYEYDTSSLRDPHQMTAAVGPNGDRTEYVYYKESDTLPGESAALAWIVSSKEELAKQVTEIADDSQRPVTQFAYDFSQGASSVYTTTVKDARQNDTVYTLNPHGSPTRIQEPLGKETVIGWRADDILKQDERDALGRLTRFGYDERGNLTQETIEKDGVALAETTYAYDPTFNKLTYKKDAEGRETHYTIDPTYGDLLATVDPVSNRTEYHYDADGQLDWTKDPRGFTSHFGSFNDFGSPREIVNALGQVTYRTYDSRNRLVVERQEPYGRETRTVYDGFDRPVENLRLSGGAASADERTLTEYYPGGQPQATTSPLGARTVYALDGMNRVVATSVPVGGETLTTETRYDPNGNKVEETDRRGVTRLHSYDALNRLERTDLVAGGPGNEPQRTIATFGYDLVGNKVRETDPAGRETRYDYDDLYRVKTKWLPVTMPAGFTPPGQLHEDFVYDRVGNVRSSKDANGHETLKAYDGLNRPTQVTDPAGRVTTIAYDDLEGSHVNKSREQELPRGLVTEYLYDALNRETRKTVLLEGEDGDPAPNPGPYLTATAYLDDQHTVQVTDARGALTTVALDGLDRERLRTVDPGGLDLQTETEYDGAGNKTRIVDPRGNATTSRYDALGRLLAVRDARQQEATYTYDGEGLKTSETDRRGVTTLHTYDNLGRPRRSELAAAPFSSVAWSREVEYVDAIPALRRETDANSHTTVFELDGLDRVVKETDALAHTVETTWDGVNRRAVRDKRGNATQYEYDVVNRVTKVTDPAPFQAQTVETTYQDALNRVTEKDRRGTLKVTQTDPLGRVVSITAASGTEDEAVLERNTYDPLGNKVLAVDGEGKKTQFVYDNASRLESRTDGFETADAATTQYRYDANGNQTKVIDPRSSEAEPSEEHQYDELNRVSDTWDGERNHTTYGYDSSGNRTSVQTPKGELTTYQYDELNKLISVTQPEPATGKPNPVTQYAYDPNRNHVRQTDANGHAVAMEYDELNRLKKRTQDPDGLALVTQTLQFDANGNPTLVEDPKGQKVTSTYDELNRLTSKAFAFAPSDPERPWRHTTSTDYGYDANGNLLEVDEHVASGSDPPSVTLVTARTYDRLNRLSGETEPLPDGGSRTVSYTYYANGVRETVTGPEGAVAQYTYDGQNRLQSATTDVGTPGAKTTSHTFWPDSLLKTVTYPNGVVAAHTYDKADRLLALTNTRDATTVSSYVYTYDPNGNRLTQVETNGGAAETTTYTYDNLDRLATITYPVDVSYPNGRVVSYDYDGVGNRVRETEKDSADTVLADKQGVFDNVNRLTALNDLVTPANSTTFTWDPNGNQTSKTTNGTTTTYTYDIRDKLAEVTEGASTLARFQYDAEGRLLKKIGAPTYGGDTGVRQYVYDQTSRLLEYDGAGAAVARFSYGSERLISMWHLTEGTRFYHLDGLRSVTALTDTNGAVTANLRLDTWGNFRFPDQDLSTTANRFAFTGHVFDTETGLYLAKARFLDPKLGRFITQDSNLGQIDRPPSLHRYLYASDNPTTRIDLTGYDDADANALAKAMSTSSAGWMASDHRPAYQKSWTRNYLETLYVEVPIRAMPGQAKMFEGMARQDAKEFASGAGEAVAVAATPLVVKEGGGALLDRVPALGRFLRKDLGELASSAVSKGKAALEGATSRLKGLFGEPPAGGNSLVPATGVQPPPAPEAVPGLNTGPFEVPPAASAPKKVPHKATLAVLDPEGNPILTENLVSGGSGKPKPTWPEQGAVHTEGKGTTRVRELLDSGVAVDEAAFSGQLRPCPMCKGNMNKLHRETGVPSTYVDQTGAVWRSTNAPPRPRAPRPAPAPMPAPTPAVPERPLE